jgi:transcriptional regulator with XRE-family HTH domain
MANVISLRLTDAMKARGLDAKTLGRMIYGEKDRHAGSRVNEWATGVHTPTRQSLQKVADALQIPVAVFID